jgi:hypothetical protein
MRSLLLCSCLLFALPAFSEDTQSVQVREPEGQQWLGFERSSDEPSEGLSLELDVG